MDISEAIKHIKKAVDEEIPHLKQLKYDNQEDYYLWHSKMQNILEASFGKASDKYIEFRDIARFTELSRNLSIPSNIKQSDYLKNLTKLEMVLKSIMQNYKILGVKTKPSATAGQPPKAFIAHEGETKALGKLEDFLDALGVKHSIAEKEPSDGRQIEGQVASTYEQADFVIILATKGKAINRKTGTPYMGLNVADELGRAREAKKRIVLLLETGVDPHTNISGIVYERFTPQGMDKAFIKIARELKNWGFIRAGKVGA